MIPKIVAPLTGLTVLVTRPAAPGAVLCERIALQGGTPVMFAALAIEPIAWEGAAASGYDLVIFLSVNAVTHGARHVEKAANTRIAAIGKATALALEQAQLPADIVPQAQFTSEALLAHPEFQLASGARVLIVRGAGGRELLQETLQARGVVVESREVYRRVRAQVAPEEQAALEARWEQEGIDVVTITSVETLHNLLEMLGQRGRELLASTPIVVPSRRIMQAAEQAGLKGGAILAPGADDDSMLGALAVWRTRARAR